jgi:hypothetical protein
MSILGAFGAKFVAGSLVAVAGIGGVAAFAMSNPTIQADYKAVQTSIMSKDLSGYKTNKAKLITDEAQAQTDKVNATTQDQLNTMSDKQTKNKATQDAIKNNDYAAFKANADQRMLQRVNSQDAFTKLVNSSKARTDQLLKLDEAIKNNDSTSYVAIVKAGEANEPTNPNSNGKTEKQMTDAQIQTRFDKEEASYKADGSLPSQRMGGMRGGYEGENGGRNGMYGNGGHRGGNWSGKNTTTTTNQSSLVPAN